MGKKKVFSPLKWQIVGLLKSGDKKQNEIANMLETGTVSDRSRSGRPRKLTFRDENYIFREIRKDPTSSYQKLATDFNSKTQGFRAPYSGQKTPFNHKKIDKKDISGVNRDLIGQLQNGGGSAGIWGCISYKGTGISNIYTGRINQYVNINTLKNILLPSVELLFEPDDPWTFQQDGASAHT
ncbi:Transposable element Tc3, partial [Brachionus plicatilis]